MHDNDGLRWGDMTLAFSELRLYFHNSLGNVKTILFQISANKHLIHDGTVIVECAQGLYDCDSKVYTTSSYKDRETFACSDRGADQKSNNII